MSHAKKEDKFFISTVYKSGGFKGKRLLGSNHVCREGSENLTLQELLDFLKEKGIEPSRVELLGTFITSVVKK